MKDSDMLQYIRIINEIKPKLIVGYPSSLELLSKFIQASNYQIYSPKGMITGGETLHELQRQTIQNTFNCKVLNRYGCREVGHIANECQQQKGLHISSDHIIIEVVNEIGEPCKYGELGEIVVTDLDNYVFPFIRYKIGDIGILSKSKCPCGRNLPLLESVEGRSFDLVLGSNGNRVPGNFFTLLRYSVNGIDKFQVIQEKFKEILIRLVVNKEWNEREQEHLLYLIKEKLGQEMKIDLLIVDSIKTGASGKFRWVTSQISPFKK